MTENRKREILRYLGYGQKDADKAVNLLINQAAQEIRAVVSPKSIYQVYPICTMTEDKVVLPCFEITSRQLKRHLDGCHEVILFAATLGLQVDQLIKRYEQIQMSKAVVLQAVATALIEEYCDQTCEKISQEQLVKGNFIKTRFSPGYGDFSLEYQKQLTGVLETGKRIGIVLTDTLIMSPSKSVTALIGITKNSLNSSKKGCRVCEKTNCIYRKEIEL